MEFQVLSYLSTFLKSDDMRIILSAILLVLAQNVGAQTNIVGCTVPSACNYNPEATINDPTSCDFVSCQIEGCLVPIACNYNPEATISAPCDFITCQGCTDECACNYDDEASIENGTCSTSPATPSTVAPLLRHATSTLAPPPTTARAISCFIVFGCNNPSACNFDPEIRSTTGHAIFVSCIPQGCTIEEACNYDAEAQLDNGTCEFTSCAGCTEECAPNYDATATIDNGSCEAVLGCTNALASCNFDPCADTNDGSWQTLVLPDCGLHGCHCMQLRRGGDTPN